MTGRLPRRPVSATATTRALVDYMYRTYHAGATVERYGGLACRGAWAFGRYGGLTLPPRGAPSRSARALATPTVRWPRLAVVYDTIEKIKYN